ncbi:MAG TPA: response regulator transcription factor [Nitrobacter sp.]|jgi:DNA-binding CsgD family transcriptional regulator|nr:response regulator transcription factor [Nitrobacter sp.]
MDQVVSGRLSETEWQPIIAALSNGLIIVRSNGEIAWMDEKTRRRVNGELQNLDLPLRKSAEGEIDCFVTVATVTIHGERSVVCVIQEMNDHQELGHELMAAIQAVMADTSRAIVDKLKALRQTAPPRARSAELDLLTSREREVLGLICEGCSDAEMSRMLNLSPNTVRNHVASLFRKIGVNRRSAAIIWARERAITIRDVVSEAQRKNPPMY